MVVVGNALHGAAVGIKVDARVGPFHRLVGLAIAVEADVMDINADALVLERPGAQDGERSGQVASRNVRLDDSVGIGLGGASVESALERDGLVDRVDGGYLAEGAMTGRRVIGKFPCRDETVVADTISVDAVEGNNGLPFLSSSHSPVPIGAELLDDALVTVAVHFHAALDGQGAPDHVGTGRDIGGLLEFGSVGKQGLERLGVIGLAVAHGAVVGRLEE